LVLQLDFFQIILAQSLIIILGAIQRSRLAANGNAESHPKSLVRRKKRRRSHLAERYREKINEMMKKFDEHIKPCKEWETIFGKDNLVIWKATCVGPRVSYRSESIMESTAASVFDLLQDINKKSGTAHIYESVKLVEAIDESTRIIYAKTVGTWMFSARDFVLLCHSRYLSDGSLLGVCSSIEHPDCPVDPSGSIVRGDVDIQGDLCAPISPRLSESTGKCRLTRMVVLDPCGYIPASLINLAIIKCIGANTEVLQQSLCEIHPKNKSKFLKRQKRQTFKKTASEASLERLAIRLDTLEERLKSRVSQDWRRQYGVVLPVVVSAMALVIVYRARK